MPPSRGAAQVSLPHLVIFSSSTQHQNTYLIPTLHVRWRWLCFLLPILCTSPCSYKQWCALGVGSQAGAEISPGDSSAFLRGVGAVPGVWASSRQSCNDNWQWLAPLLENLTLPPSTKCQPGWFLLHCFGLLGCHWGWWVSSKVGISLQSLWFSFPITSVMCGTSRT